MKQQTLINDDSINHKERVLPEWCKCMLWEWEGYETIPPACNFFIDNGNGYCCNCGHSVDCHTNSKQDKIIEEILKLTNKNPTLLADIIHQLILKHCTVNRI